MMQHAHLPSLSVDEYLARELAQHLVRIAKVDFAAGVALVGALCRKWRLPPYSFDAVASRLEIGKEHSL